MDEPQELVSAAEARKAVQDMCRRIGLLHMCYARAIVDALGEEEGKDLIRQAIWDYGTRIGEKTRQQVIAQGLEPTVENMGAASDLSPIGWDMSSAVIDGEPRHRVFDCAIAQPWLEYGEEDLGDLYCLVDPAKMQAYDPEWTMVHVRKITRGDSCCELARRRRKGGA